MLSAFVYDTFESCDVASSAFAKFVVQDIKKIVFFLLFDITFP